MFNWIGKSEDGNTVTLKKLSSEMLSFPVSSELGFESSNSIGIGAVIDVETTGLDLCKDKVIEIGLRLFKFSITTGEVISLDSYYSAFEDPNLPLSDRVQILTGINNAMLKGQNIDWNYINALLSKCQIIIAHNASFDRSFIDRNSEISKMKIWACSLKQIDWMSHGFTSHKLDLLSIYHGFFTDAHRALNDADALIYLLSLKNKISGTPYLLELLKNASKPSILVKAWNAPIKNKDLLKVNGYRWQVNQRVWDKTILEEHRETEIKWLTEDIYEGKCLAELRTIELIDHFKNIA